MMNTQGVERGDMESVKRSRERGRWEGGGGERKGETERR